MVEVGVVDYANYILAGVAAGGAGLAAYRWYRGGTVQRRRAKAEYQALWQEVYGSPSLVDDHGVEYEPSQNGLVQRLDELAGAFYGHDTHPPHPGRRRTDQRKGDSRRS